MRENLIQFLLSLFPLPLTLLLIRHARLDHLQFTMYHLFIVPLHALPLLTIFSTRPRKRNVDILEEGLEGGVDIKGFVGVDGVVSRRGSVKGAAGDEYYSTREAHGERK